MFLSRKTICAHFDNRSLRLVVRNVYGFDRDLFIIKTMKLEHCTDMITLFLE